MEVELAVTITVLLHKKHSHLLSRGYRIFLPWDTTDALAVRPQPTLRDHYNASTLSMKEGRGGRGSFRNRRWDKFMSGQVFLSLHGRKILWLQEWALRENAASCLLPNSLSATITNTIFLWCRGGEWSVRNNKGAIISGSVFLGPVNDHTCSHLKPQVLTSLSK